MIYISEKISAYFTLNNINNIPGESWDTAQYLDEEDKVVLWDTTLLGTQPTNEQLDTAWAAYQIVLTKQVNKAKARQLLIDTDWSQYSDVQASLANIVEFVSYRNQIRNIFTNPTVEVVWPDIPATVWK